MDLKKKGIDVLLVEDNPGDARLMKEALSEGNVPCHLIVVEDGVAAMNYLRQQGVFSNALRPHLVLLDLNLPKKDGRQVLTEVKDDPALRSIPVVILSGSSDLTDVALTYANHANCYIVKPFGLDEFIEVMNLIKKFWLAVAKLPADD